MCVREKMWKSRRADNKISYSKCFGVAFSQQILLFSCACIWILEFVAFTVVSVIVQLDMVVEKKKSNTEK